MNFEKTKEEINAEEQTGGIEISESQGEREITPESLFGKSLRCFKRWGTLGVAVGAFLITQRMEKHFEGQDREWRDHVAATFKDGDSEKMKIYESQIREFFGETAIRDIEYGDKLSYLKKEKGEERKPPELEGFLGRGWTNTHKYTFTEKYKYYPRGWINGEVGKVEYVDSLKKIGSEGRLKGGQFGRGGLFTPEPVMYLYRHWEKIGDDEYCPVKSETVAHELGHANDWENDMDLNLLERQELLIGVYKRLQSENSYHRSDGGYHEDFLDGTVEGSYRAAREYWADICSEYFSDPQSFRDKFPEDFELVNIYVLKNDPSFDVFDENRGAFDRTTGKLKEFWKGK